MAIQLECNYSKKLGLPGYSSHQFSITLRTEISDMNQVQAESARLYTLLQEGVDNSIKEIGYLPTSNGNGNGNGNGHHTGRNGNGNGNGSGYRNGLGNANGKQGDQDNEAWKCSPKQKGLILDIVADHKLDNTEVDKLAQDRFGKGVIMLNKLEASGLIEELLEQTGQQGNGRGRFQGNYQRRGGR